MLIMDLFLNVLARIKSAGYSKATLVAKLKN